MNARCENENRVARSTEFGHTIPAATVEGIEYYEDRRLDKAQILRFSTCKYIEEGHHIILKGASGNGKTYLACALGNAACRKFKSVRYIRMPELLDELVLARAEGAFKKVIKAYQKVDLLILDEWLMDQPILPPGNPMLEPWMLPEKGDERGTGDFSGRKMEGCYNLWYHIREMILATVEYGEIPKL